MPIYFIFISNTLRQILQLDSLAKEINQENPIEHDKGEEFDSTPLESYMNSTMWMAGQSAILAYFF